MNLKLTSSVVLVSTLVIFVESWQDSDAQYISPNSFMWGNYGFSATGVDMYGDTSFYSYTPPPKPLYDYVNSGTTSHSYTPDYYSENQYDSYTPDFSESYEEYESPKITFEEGRDIVCNPKLVSLDEILEETYDAKFSIISREIDGFSLDGHEYNCLVGVRTLDGRNIMGYGEIKFNSKEEAKKIFTDYAENVLKQDSYDRAYQIYNTLYTAMRFDDFEQEMEFTLKDEYILVILNSKSDDYDDYFNCPNCISAIAVNRINPEYITTLDFEKGDIVRLPSCKDLFLQKNDLDFPSEFFQVRSGQYAGKLLLNENGDQAIDGLKIGCQIDIAFPDFVRPSQTLTIYDLTFDSASSTQNFYMLLRKTIDEAESNKKILIQENFINNNSFSAEGDHNSSVSVIQEKNHVVAFLAKPTPYPVLTFDDYKPLIHKAISRINPQIKSASAESSEKPIPESPIKPSSQKTMLSYSDEIHIVSIVPITQQGMPIDSFVKGRPGFVKVTITADSPMETLIAASVFDSDLTSLSVGSVKTKLMPDTSYEMLLSVYIPKDASIGDASIFVNTFTDWPALGGIPQSQEKSTTTRIK